MNAAAKEKTEIKTIKMHSASARLSDVDYKRLVEMVGPDKLNTNVCAFCTSAIQLTLDLLEAKASKPPLPKFIEIGRFTMKVNARANGKKQS